MEYDLNDLKEKMEKAIEALKKEFMGLRTGRAHINLLDSVRVDLYGQLSPLNQVSTVAVPESRTLSVQVWDKSMVKAVEKGILNADLGLSPVVEGQLIRIHLPELSEERRRDLVKIAAKYSEACRVSIRNIRRDGMDVVKKMEKNHESSKDDAHKFTAEIQKLTDEYIKKIDSLFHHKEQDILTL